MHLLPRFTLLMEIFFDLHFLLRRTTLKRKDQNYQYFLDSSPSFNDPNHIEQLYQEVGLDFNEVYTNMSSLKGRYPSQEYAAELRNSQNSKWAFRYVFFFF